MGKKPSGVPIDGQRLKRLREAAHLSQEDLGKLIGVVQETVVRYEKGQRRPGWETAHRLAAVLGLSDISGLLTPSPEEWKREQLEAVRRYIKESGYTYNAFREMVEMLEREDKEEGEAQ